MWKKHGFKIVLGLAAVLLIGSFIYANKASEQANEGVVIEPHVKGNLEAEVTLTEYSDFQCPACGQYYPYLKEIMEEYGDSIRFEYRHFPLITVHPYAVPAARASEAAAQQGKFWEMHDMLFENQSTWSNSSNPEAYFRQYAENIGLDVDLFNRHLNASKIGDAIDDSFNEARDRGFTGTPTLLLNDEVLEVNSFSQFRSEIQAAIGVEVDDTKAETEEEV